MRVRLIKKKTIAKYALKNSSSRIPFDIWVDKLRSADWNNANDIKETYGSADNIGKSSNRIVFNIGGNNYRMICTYQFGRLCDDNLQFTINKY